MLHSCTPVYRKHTNKNFQNIKELTNTIRSKRTNQQPQAGTRSQGYPTGTQETSGRMNLAPREKFIPTTREVRVPIKTKLHLTATKQEAAAKKDQEIHGGLGAGETESELEEEEIKELDQLCEPKSLM